MRGIRRMAGQNGVWPSSQRQLWSSYRAGGGSENLLFPIETWELEVRPFSVTLIESTPRGGTIGSTQTQNPRQGAALMKHTTKYVALDVHQEATATTVRDHKGRVIARSVLPTEEGTLLELFRGMRGSIHVTFEEGTWAAWLYDLLAPHVAQVVVCNPRKNALLKAGNKSDRIDARKLAELLRTGLL